MGSLLRRLRAAPFVRCAAPDPFSLARFARLPVVVAAASAAGAMLIPGEPLGPEQTRRAGAAAAPALFAVPCGRGWLGSPRRVQITIRPQVERWPSQRPGISLGPRYTSIPATSPGFTRLSRSCWSTFMLSSTMRGAQLSPPRVMVML
jgi:hypothetical protein